MAHHFHPSILREYDMRGIVGETLAEADGYAVGRSFGTIIARAGGTRVAVGYDGRLSSVMLEAAVVRGLNDSGIDALRIGLGPSPMLYWAEAECAVDGGIQITGSHNPRDHNGFKIVAQHRPFFGEDIKQLAAIAAAGDWQDGAGTSEQVDIAPRYVQRLLRDFDGAPCRIGWDAGNGAAGPVLEQLVNFLPGEHHVIFAEVDGNFPNHHPDPTEERNLADLRTLVLEKKLDFGVAFDGDGDRIGAIDGQGRVIWADQLLAILAQVVLRERPGATIIGDVKAGQGLFDRIAALGGVPLMWKSGHSNIKSKMKETGSPLAGEMSGHIFLAHHYYGFDDALYAALCLIRAATLLGRSVTQLRDSFPDRIDTPELRFQVDDDRKFVVVAEILARLRAAGMDVDDTDGARVTTPDGWWLLRASHTQDMLVARAEASDRAGLARLLDQIDSQLAESGIKRDSAASD